MHQITVFNLGNADTTRIDLENSKKLLVDYADMRRGSKDPQDKRVDLPVELRKDLEKAKKDYYDVVAFTHVDQDHTLGSSEFFYFEHAAKYQSSDRIKIKEMWVPAAVILEEGCEDDARVIVAEARYRFRQGKGIRVFSSPGLLDDWLWKNHINPESRRDIITDAGNLIPGFNLATDKVEFFVHSPFASRTEDGKGLIVRNRDALTFQGTFEVDGRKTRMHFFSDIDFNVIKYIVRVTENRAKKDPSRLERLIWDICDIPHHSSYKSLAEEKGKDITEPDEDVKRLFEKYVKYACIMTSPSDPIPSEDTDQPPHRQAANYYKKVAKDNGGQYLVSMEQPTKQNPKPIVIKIDRFGATVEKSINLGGTTAIASQVAPRAGKSNKTK